MERYCSNFVVDAFQWPDLIKDLPDLPFACVKVLGSGANCSVHTLAKADRCPKVCDDDDEEEEESDDEPPNWAETFFGGGDVDSYSSVGDDSSDESSDFVSESADEWENVESNPGEVMPMTTQSPMGCVEVVAKRFSRVDNDCCYVAHHPKTKARLRIESDPRTFIEWLNTQDSYVTSTITQHITPSAACFSEFVSESLCHLLLTDLVDKGITPNIIMAFRAFKCGGKGYLIQERITTSLSEVLEENPGMTCKDLAGFYLQAFATLHMLQSTCDFKHHDLHPGNVFVKRIDDTMMWKGKKMIEATHFTYELDDGVVLTFPNNGYIVKIGDFGFSSLGVHGRRLQRLDLSTYARGSSDGEWNAELKSRRGHDGQVCMSMPPFEYNSDRVNDPGTIELLQRLRRATQGPTGKLSRSRYKPVVVSDVSPMEVIKQVFVESPPECADFLNPVKDEDAVVICLSSVSDLNKTPPRPSSDNKKSKRRRTRHFF